MVRQEGAKDGAGVIAEMSPGGLLFLTLPGSNVIGNLGQMEDLRMSGTAKTLAVVAPTLRPF